MGPTAAIISAVGSSIGAFSSIKTLQANKKARRQQERLEDERKTKLASEAATREAARKRAETLGQRVGRPLQSQFSPTSAASIFTAGVDPTGSSATKANVFGGR